MNALIRSLVFSLLFAAELFVPTARAQLMKITMESSHLEADFYSYDVTLPLIDGIFQQHYRHPIAGTMQLTSTIDLSNFSAPGTLNIAFHGNAENIGDFAFEFGAFTATRLPSGAIDLSENTWPQGSPVFNLIVGLRINPDLSAIGTEPFEFRTFADTGPGEFWGDSTLWANFDRITVTPVAMTPVPEPTLYGAIAGLGLLGIVRWRSRRAVARTFNV